MTVSDPPNEQLAVSEKEVPPPPDGGLEAWLVVVGAWCTSFCSFGWVNSESDLSSRTEGRIVNNYRYWNLSELL